MHIEYEKEAAKHISKMDTPTKHRIKAAIEKLPTGDVTKLQGLTDDYRLRVGDLRVLFSVHSETIIIKDVLPRGRHIKDYRKDNKYEQRNDKNDKKPDRLN